MTKILEVKDLEISFDTYAGKVRAIRGVNFHLNKGENIGDRWGIWKWKISDDQKHHALAVKQTPI